MRIPPQAEMTYHITKLLIISVTHRAKMLRGVKVRLYEQETQGRLCSYDSTAWYRAKYLFTFPAAVPQSFDIKIRFLTFVSYCLIEKKMFMGCLKCKCQNRKQSFISTLAHSTSD